MSLYEPSIRSSSWTFVSSSFTRPLTTLEGWREIGLGVYAMSSNIRMFFIPQQFGRKTSSNHGELKASTSCLPVSDRDNVRSVLGSVRPPESPVGSTVRPPPRCPGKEHQYGSEETGHLEKKIQPEAAEEPYHVFSRRKKWLLVLIICATGILHGLTQDMYLPATDTIGRDLNISLQVVTSTIATYLLLQGLVGLIWRPLSDSIGRRPVYICCFSIYILASVPLSFARNFAILLTLRGIQSATIACAVCIGSDVIQDLLPPMERDGFLKFYQNTQGATAVLAPILGGLLSKVSGFRSIFAFLTSLSIVIFLLLAICLPETQRRIAGNGSVRLSGIHRAFADCRGSPDTSDVIQHRRKAEAPRLITAFLEPLNLLKEKDIVLSMVFGGVVFAVWTMMTVSTPGLFKRVFGLNDLELGLALVPNALGAVAGSNLTRNILDRDLSYASAKYKAENLLSPSLIISTVNTLPADFPLEHTRLRHLPWALPMFIIVLCSYGFTLAYPSATQRPCWLLLPLILQFVMGATASLISVSHQILVEDLWHRGGHASIAASSLVKYLLASLGVGLVQHIISDLGTWSAFLALALVLMGFIPLPVVQWYWGSVWRAEREVNESTPPKALDV